MNDRESWWKLQPVLCSPVYMTHEAGHSIPERFFKKKKRPEQANKFSDCGSNLSMMTFTF
jgi:hypothetical protein